VTHDLPREPFAPPCRLPAQGVACASAGTPLLNQLVCGSVLAWADRRGIRKGLCAFDPVSLTWKAVPEPSS